MKQVLFQTHLDPINFAVSAVFRLLCVVPNPLCMRVEKEINMDALNSVKDLLVDELKDLYSAEK